MYDSQNDLELADKTRILILEPKIGLTMIVKIPFFWLYVSCIIKTTGSPNPISQCIGIGHTKGLKTLVNGGGMPYSPIFLFAIIYKIKIADVTQHSKQLQKRILKLSANHSL